MFRSSRSKSIRLLGAAGVVTLALSSASVPAGAVTSPGSIKSRSSCRLRSAALTEQGAVQEEQL